MGPDKKTRATGNVLLETPKEKPQLITCFNLGFQLKPPEKDALAEQLAEALQPGGLVFVDEKSAADRFGQKLAARLRLVETKESYSVYKKRFEKKAGGAFNVKVLPQSPLALAERSL